MVAKLDINEGMTVFASDGEELGEVVDVQYGDEKEYEPGPETSTPQGTEIDRDSNFITELAEAFTGEDRVPEEVEEHLLRHGYIKVDKGIFSAPHYTTLDKIARIDGDEIHLEVTKGNLVSL